MYTFRTFIEVHLYLCIWEDGVAELWGVDLTGETDNIEFEISDDKVSEKVDTACQLASRLSKLFSYTSATGFRISSCLKPSIAMVRQVALMSVSPKITSLLVFLFWIGKILKNWKFVI